MAAEPVTITPHDPRRTAFRAVVAALKDDAALAPYVAAWDVRDGDTNTATTEIKVTDHTIRLTPVYERTEAMWAAGGVRTWQCPITVNVETRVASANADNAINLAGLIEDAATAIPTATLHAAGVSWVELVQPPAQADEYATHAGAFRLMVYINR
jgi:hypothetical protein